MGINRQMQGDSFLNYYVSCNRFTVWVQCVRGKSGNIAIVDCAPIVSKFRGQYLSNLIKWAKSFGGFKIEELK